MMKKLLIVLLILVIVFLIVFVFGNDPAGEDLESTPTPTVTSTPVSGENDDSNEETSQDLPTTHVVEIFDDGFRPANLTISVGDTVQFVNEGTRKHWPASDVHPTHSVCPGFDAKKGLDPGETYEYTFNEVETCPMHDHLQSSMLGEIVIEAR